MQKISKKLYYLELNPIFQIPRGSKTSVERTRGIWVDGERCHHHLLDADTIPIQIDVNRVADQMSERVVLS